MSMSIADIQNKVQKREYRFSEHAIKRMIERNIERFEVKEAILNGEIIEEYPKDKYSQSCLIYGKTQEVRDLHVQVSLPPQDVIVISYEPDPEELIDCRIRG